MTLTEYYGLPEGANMTLAYSSFYDTVDSNFPCPPNMSYAFSYEQRTTLKPIDVSNVTNMQYMFYDCGSLTSIKGIENWNTSNVTNMRYLFYGCDSLTSLDLSNWDVSNVTNMESLFQSCIELTSLDLSNWDVSNVTNLSKLFYYCINLTSIKLNEDTTVNVTNMTDMFYNCKNLESLSALRADKVSFASYNGPFGYSELSNLVNFGGFIGLKTSITSNYGFTRTPNLSYESCINVLNGLYDFTGNGETPTSSQGKLKVHQNFLDKVGDEISIGTGKGWVITV